MSGTPEQEADRVVPLTYAVAGAQSGRNFYNYKDVTVNERTRENAFAQIVPFMWAFTVDHADCLDRAATRPVDAVCIVPSGRGREGAHPLERIARHAPPRWTRTDATRIAAPRSRFDPASIGFAQDQDLDGAHLVVIDDTWVKGASAETVGMAARRRGAAEITILAVARWLEPRFGNTREIHAAVRANGHWTRERCPVGGGDCRIAASR
ncbi:phosphoribosyltransferase [Microbacterium paludicola]|uniref:phosphoribosyltransferase n=1 Tax=Microbacterium paludicola TaxID=300019 RepID=UPI00387A65D2